MVIGKTGALAPPSDRGDCHLRCRREPTRCPSPARRSVRGERRRIHPRHDPAVPRAGLPDRPGQGADALQRAVRAHGARRGRRAHRDRAGGLPGRAQGAVPREERARCLCHHPAQGRDRRAARRLQRRRENRRRLQRRRAPRRRHAVRRPLRRHRLRARGREARVQLSRARAAWSSVRAVRARRSPRRSRTPARARSGCTTRAARTPRHSPRSCARTFRAPTSTRVPRRSRVSRWSSTRRRWAWNPATRFRSMLRRSRRRWSSPRS